jgi:hypothetical protein
VLYHLPEGEIDASLAELARVLAPGGHLIATTGSNNDHAGTSAGQSCSGIDCDAELVFPTRERLVAYVEGSRQHAAQGRQSRSSQSRSDCP